jgi:serine/threonine-protein phosphatase 6 regulatory ankyrin repeat subunit B
VDILIEAGAHVYYARPKNGCTALYIASHNGHREVVDSLVRAGADANQTATDEDAYSPLIIAAERGHVQCVHILIEAGAHVNYATRKVGSTALMIASQNGHHNVIRSLVRAGANVNQTMTDKDADSSSLIFAAAKGHVQCVDILIEAGAFVNYARPKNGGTALFFASQHGHIDVVRSLLATNADPLLTLHNGKTALDAANLKHHTQIVALIEANIADHNRSV